MPFVLIDKLKTAIQEDKQSEEIIENFVMSNIGTISIGNESTILLQKLLKEFNEVRD